MEHISNNVFFGIIISLVAFEIGLYIRKKTKLDIFNPLLIAIALVIIFLLIFNIDVSDYSKGADFINMFLGPATIVLAVPLYKQLHSLKKYLIPILSGVFIGSVICIFSVIILCIVLKLDESIKVSLLSKSVTTPIGIEITNSLGGISSITILSIVLTGIVGSVIGPSICKVFKIKNEIAIGLALGTSAHAVGTSKALELGEVQGAMSSLSIGIAGLMTVFLAPLLYNITISIIG
ncbi:MAG: LrgB family protein [Clostridium sp.]